MGVIVGKLWRKKTTVEVLEKLDKEIRSIEEYRRNTEQSHKRIVGRFILISVGIYLLTAFLFYFYFFPATFYDRLFYIIPLILAPVIILSVKRVLSWYYKWKISRKQNKLSTLKEDKKKMLEKVMETETYKVAKVILEKFSEPVIRKSTAFLANTDFTTPAKILTPTHSSTVITGGLRQRALPPPSGQLSIMAATPLTRPLTATASNTNLQSGRTPGTALPAAVPSTPLPMPRAILPRDRSVFDKMVDYLVGDGPTNRYALICKTCSSHNGMAFREEFEYISFRCCYCYTLNPARKKRPVAPKLEFDLKSSHLMSLSRSDSSASEKNSPSDTDSETETLHNPNASELQENGVPHDDIIRKEDSLLEEPLAMEVENVDVPVSDLKLHKADKEEVEEVPVKSVHGNEEKEVLANVKEEEEKEMLIANMGGEGEDCTK